MTDGKELLRGVVDGPPAAADRQEIEDLLAAYVLALDVDDVDTAVGLFTEDGEFRTHGRVFAGSKLRRMFETAPKGMHLAGRSLVTASAHGATVCSQLLFLPADRGPHRMAIYRDEVVRVAGRWQFRSRECWFMDTQGEWRANP
jgi:hypothetical protein